MAFYPLKAPYISCRGAKIERIQKAAELYRVGERIVAYINRQMEEGSDEIRVFIYGAAANKRKVEPTDVELAAAAASRLSYVAPLDPTAPPGRDVLTRC